MATNGADKSLGDVVSEVSEKASLLVREEIELAKAEISEKVTKLGKGAAALAAAGVLAVFALIYLFEALAWFFVVHQGWGLPGAYASFIFGSTLEALAVYLRYRAGAWQRTSV